MRTFIAIELPKNIKDALASLQEQLKVSGADVKWVAPENIHLTLKFLGEIDDTKLNKVIKILEDTAVDKTPFQIRISSIGAFPKINFPRVIWAGIDKGDNETKEIAKELEERIAKIGIPKEGRAFSSHITIGRLRSTLNREKLIKDLGMMSYNFGDKNLAEFGVTKITLLKSTLTPGGPIYEILKEAHLKAS
jgi:2'-5' RNA ligase